MKNTFFLLFILFQVACSQQEAKYVLQKPVIAGDFVHIFNPNDTRFEEDTTWYTNDHGFAKDSLGNWHAYGIIGHKPIRPWGGETKFFHVSSDKLKKERWTDHDYALVVKPGAECVLWAPSIYQEDGNSYMFYNIGNMQQNASDYCSWGQLCLATSRDMFNWERHDRNPLFSDPGHARDSYIMKRDGIYYYYYTRTFNEVDHRSCVAVRTSHNLKEWSGPQIVHIQPYVNYWAGDAESPFVVYKDGYYYLFICLAMTEYNRTDVYWSKDPLSFPIENFVTSLPVHACEIIYDEKDGWFISNTGWDKKGLYIADLKWENIK